MNPNLRRLGLLAGASLLAAAAGCGSPATPSGQSSASSAAGGQALTVFAAASLKGTFTTLGTQFGSANSGIKVTFSFGGSSDLVTQLQQGAPGDVFASADQKAMDRAADEKVIVPGTRRDFAAN